MTSKKIKERYQTMDEHGIMVFKFPGMVSEQRAETKLHMLRLQSQWWWPDCVEHLLGCIEREPDKFDRSGEDFTTMLMSVYARKVMRGDRPAVDEPPAKRLKGSY